MSSQPAGHRRSRIAWSVLTLVLILEGIGGAALVWGAVQGFFASSDEPLGQRLSVLLALLLAWAWVCVTLGGALRARAGWVRGSAITIHVLMFAAGTGVLQGIFAEPLLGWALVLLAFAGFAAAIVARPQVQELPAE